MKLLYCLDCQDVFLLTYEERRCRCGLVTGRYVDFETAVTNGEGVSLAIGNGSLREAIERMRDLDRRQYPHPFYPIMAWVRPNEGNANPNTKVVK